MIASVRENPLFVRINTLSHRILTLGKGLGGGEGIFARPRFSVATEFRIPPLREALPF